MFISLIFLVAIAAVIGSAVVTSKKIDELL
jgi:hypothetical protein